MKPAGRRSLIVAGHGGNHGRVYFILFSFFLFAAMAAAQSDPTRNNNQEYARFSPSMAVIVVVLVSALFFMGFFSIYIRHCGESSGAGSIGRALSQRARRAAAARGLDQSVLETFPTFPYSEVKDHKIGKGGLECAVCLNEFEDTETLRLLPKCDHVFHAECIDAWLESHVTCPVCRANLVVQAAAADDGDQAPPTDQSTNTAVERSNSTNDEIVIQVSEDSQQPANRSFEYPSRPPRSWSIPRPKIFNLGKYRSHSTGHDSLVQPVETLDRFTLRLPAQVRKEVIDRAMLNRARSCAVTLPREGSSRRGYRTGGGEGSSRAGRSYRRMEIPDRDARSDRWVFFTRMLSMKSPKVGAEIGEGSNSKQSGNKAPVKMPSFKCLEPKANGGDEAHLFSGESGRSPV